MSVELNRKSSSFVHNVGFSVMVGYRVYLSILLNLKLTRDEVFHKNYRCQNGYFGLVFITIF